MKFCKFGLFLMALLLAAGCTITAPGVKIKAPMAGVEVEMGGGGHGGGFCPPGQAKKGNC